MSISTKPRNAAAHQFGRYRGEADIRSRCGANGWDAPDPLRKSRGPKCCARADEVIE